MKITQDVREYAAQKEIDEQAALEVGMRRRRKNLLNRERRFTPKRSGANLARMKATNREPEIVTRNGKAVAVILPIKEYEELLKRKTAEDVAWLKKARRKKLTFDRSKNI